jgi:UDP-2-acetamido-3-amino-2,3-dideoxy-glucuronate N-acetyltransferase
MQQNSHIFYKTLSFFFHSFTSFRIRKYYTFMVADFTYRVHGISGVADLISQLSSDLIKPVLIKFGAQIGDHFFCKSKLEIECSVFGHLKSFSNLSIGNSCGIARNVYLDLSEKIILEDYSVLGPQSRILTHSSLADKPLKKVFPCLFSQVLIGKGSWVGANVTILPGVTIGQFSVIAAGSVVTKDVAPFTLVAGVPAKVLRKIPNLPEFQQI